MQIGEVGKGGKKGTDFRKSWGYNVLHGDYS